MNEPQNLGQLLKDTRALLEKSKEQAQEPKQVLTEQQILERIIQTGLELKPNVYQLQEQNKESVLNIAYYFMKDSRGKLDLNKGLMLMGYYGTGKTLTMRIMQRLFRNPFLISICKNVIDDYQNGGQVPGAFAHLGRRSFDVNVFSKEGEIDPKKPLTRLFDDLGAERLKHNFQDDRNVMEEILSARYEYFCYLNPPMITHITTNLPFETLTERYGHRLTDRFFEMFNIITFKGESLRK